MRTKILMMSSVALLAGTLMAAGQSIQPGGGSQDKGTSGGPAQLSEPSKEKSGKDMKMAPNRNAQSSQGTNGPAKSKESATTGGQAKGKEAPTTNGQAAGGREDAQKDQDRKPQGQTQRDPDRDKPAQAQGQAPRDQQGQNQRQAQPQRDQAQGERDQDRNQQGQREGQRAGGNTNVSVSFTTEQRTKIRETVFKQGNAPRVSNVTFSVREGTVIPRTVHVVEVPEVIIEVHPEWRGYRYFIVDEELVIVEPDTLRIVAVIDV